MIGRLTPDPAGRIASCTELACPSTPCDAPTRRPPCLPSAGPPTAWISSSTPPATGQRVALSRRGTEYIVVALRVTSAEDRHEVLIGRLPMTGEDLTFRLDQIDSFQVVG